MRCPAAALGSLAARAVVVAVNQAQSVAKQIDIAALVHVPQPRPFAALDDDRIGRVKARGAGVAARHDGGGLLMSAAEPGVPPR